MAGTITDSGLVVTRGEATTVRLSVSDLPDSGTAGWQVGGEFRVSPADEINPEPDPDTWPDSVASTDFTIVTAGGPGVDAVIDVRFTPEAMLSLHAGVRTAVFAAWETGGGLQIVPPTWADVRPQIR